MTGLAGEPAGARSASSQVVLSLGFLRFLGSGVLNTIFGYAVFIAALYLGAGIGIALFASTLLGIAFNFQTSRLLVFRSRGTGRQLHFAAVYAIVFTINYVAILSLKRLGLADWAAQAVMLMPMAAVAFTLQRHFVFCSVRGAP